MKFEQFSEGCPWKKTILINPAQIVCYVQSSTSISLVCNETNCAPYHFAKKLADVINNCAWPWIKADKIKPGKIESSQSYQECCQDTRPPKGIMPDTNWAMPIVDAINNLADTMRRSGL